MESKCKWMHAQYRDVCMEELDEAHLDALHWQVLINKCFPGGKVLLPFRLAPGFPYFPQYPFSRLYITILCGELLLQATCARHELSLIFL